MRKKPHPNNGSSSSVLERLVVFLVTYSPSLCFLGSMNARCLGVLKNARCLAVL
ncbi:expressed unknown protein [Ectocarpus siliculosus]|uniref:Uncharacterized protein n=1 Tax=Ectocarpus siliculosus TaxID=2880 RepID=D7FU96_ECTSI|nr:expressed unknown protein [Ectocarpus siliculosus]|eukprot:CBJ31623.1 expressed unknown protein [Ectocarpus siliculosus]